MARIMYDITAGDHLSKLLAQLNDKLAGFAQYRAGQKSMYLDCTPGDWTGGERTAYDGDYRTQQPQLNRYAEIALRAKASVDAANEQYRAASDPSSPGA